ncbi:glycosyltransferase family 2 protein [Microbacterium sp. W4I20]|uniref:glycosyltransferase n=1 Tax=Microbacterium sp. W4I20 TaxID=3042262 RepID=UPI00278B1E56|nr:glycosyltransferase [Microbacterium sp. W4I20]MDQ0729120.1 hypothetical protein [Microbacterium sp. W4I20]
MARVNTSAERNSTQPRPGIEYILPLRWKTDDELADLTAYLTALREWADITIIDGSDPDRFAAHAATWSGLARHIPVDGRAGMNGKVRGVLTGLAVARHEHLVIADDDVRYDRDTLTAVVSDLAIASLVKPQNHFAPLPWHARWDTARTLLNRAVASDYPGTYAVRRSTLRLAGGYSPNVLFENLEMERTIRAVGGVISDRPDIYVKRRPPTAQHFISQRSRQAYDSFAQPRRLLTEAAILPLLITVRRCPAAIALLTLSAVALAERGRRRAGGQNVFAPTSALWAPLWLCERAVTSWVAIGARLRGGVPYNGQRMRVAAHPPTQISRRLAAAGITIPATSASDASNSRHAYRTARQESVGERDGPDKSSNDQRRQVSGPGAELPAQTHPRSMLR